MNELLIKGGYGEHGRACFLVKYPNQNQYMMFDCGIMDKDPQPYPDVAPEILKKTKYIFISHAHVDHIGALEHFVKNGFTGIVVTSRGTVDFYGLEYPNLEILDCKNRQIQLDDNTFLTYGRSGHCPGSLWFHVKLEAKKYFYSGDFQQETLIFAVDKPENFEADIAIVDCAHLTIDATALECRNNIVAGVKEQLEQGKKLIFPVQKFGRGLEILEILQSNFPNLKILGDENFVSVGRKILNYPEYLKAETLGNLQNFFAKAPYCPNDNVDLLITGDTHLRSPKNQEMVENLGDDFMIFSTGRIKKDTFIEEKYAQGKAVRHPFSHHQSPKDMEKLLAQNDFKVVLPFHNNEKKVIF